MSRSRLHRTTQIFFVSMIAASMILLSAVIYTGAHAISTISQATSSTGTSCGCGQSYGWIQSDGMSWFILILLTGFIATILWRTSVVLARTRRFAQQLTIVSISPKLAAAVRGTDLAERVYEVEDKVPAAFCAGLLRPHLYLSRQAVAALSFQELKAVLLHERYHLKHRDPLKIFLVDVVGWCFSWIPVLGRATREFRTSLELAADEAVLREQRESKMLGSAILRLLPLAEQVHPEPGAPITFFNTTERRIDQLMGSTKAPQLSVLIPFLATIVVVATAIFGSGARISKASETSITLPGYCRELRRACLPTHQSLTRTQRLMRDGAGLRAPRAITSEATGVNLWSASQTHSLRRPVIMTGIGYESMSRQY